MFHPAFNFHVEQIGDEYALLHNQTQVYTGGRNPRPVVHRNEELIQHMVEEFQGCVEILINDQGAVEVPEGIPFGAYALFSDLYNFDWIKFEEQALPECLYFDGLMRDVAGPERTDQLSAYAPYHHLLSQCLGLDLETLQLAGQTAYFRMSGHMLEEELVSELTPDEYITMDKFSKSPCIELIRKEFQRLNCWEKSACIGLYFAHNQTSLLIPLLSIIHGYSASQYTTAILAAMMIRPNFPDAVEDYKQIFTQVKSDFSEAQTFIALASQITDPESELRELIARGESMTTEFKSSFRKYVEREVKERELKFSVVKTIAGFLNTDGGALLIGVADDGAIIGTQHDGYSNDDKYLLGLTDAITNALGTKVMSYMTLEMIHIESKTVCKVIVSPSKEMIDCTVQGLAESTVFIRTGPSTRELKGTEIISYNEAHFKNK